MLIAALDISYTNTGWAWMGGERGPQRPELLGYGDIAKPGDLAGYGGESYPWNYKLAARDAALNIVSRIASMGRLDAVVVEETNPAGSGRGSRYTNKILEWVHSSFLDEVRGAFGAHIFYVSNNVWRRTIGLKMTDEDKKNNKLIRKARKVQSRDGGRLAEICATLGATATVLVDRKMLSVRHANEIFGLELLKTQNDRAEAICLGEAFLRGAEVCDGIK